MKITQQYLKEKYRYDYDTGHFILIKPCQGVRLGSVVGKLYINKNSGKKYWAMEIAGRNYRAHRLVWLYVHGADPHDTIDHEDGNGLNNRIDNLRCVSQQQNNMNKIMYSNNKSGITGVCWDSKSSRWEVQIRNNKKNIKVGRFDTMLDAACARKNAEVKYGYHVNHGAFRNL